MTRIKPDHMLFALASAIAVVATLFFPAPAKADGNPFLGLTTSPAHGVYVELFHSVDATFTVPAVTCSDGSAMGFWTGINTTTVLVQAGISVGCAPGEQTEYQVFWYLYSDANQNNDYYGGLVSVGDTISVHIQRNGSEYTLSLADAQHPSVNFTVTRPAPQKETTVQLIAEQQVGDPDFTQLLATETINGRAWNSPTWHNNYEHDWGTIRDNDNQLIMSAS